jgi:DNA-binding protein Fis
MADPLDKNLAAAFDEFCLRVLRSMPADRPGDAHRTVVGLLETRLLRLALRECGENQTAAARLLGLHRNTLRQKLRDCRKLVGD